MSVDVPRRENKHTRYEGQLNTTLDKTVCYVHTFLEDNHCFTITDMRREMAVYFSHKAGPAATVHVLQQLEMQKV